jgi:dolichyl-diphosphooligosaccharide--protein glycosyltransferase
MLMAVLGQRRFGYYYAVNAALLTGYFSWKMLDIAGLRKLLAKSKAVVGAVKRFKKREKAREKAKQRTFMQPRGVWVRVIVVGIIIFFVVFFPNIGLVKNLVTATVIMNEGWYSSLVWLNGNSSEPFGDPDFYYELYPPREEFVYPETAYGVMSWWDYGYFIMQIAHRIPNANPGQVGAVQAGKFLTAQSESSAQEIVDQYNLRSRYVVIDYAMPITKFYAMVAWAGGNLSEFHEYYGVPPQVSGETPQIVLLRYPAYYNSTVVRLYNFDGKAVAPSGNSTVVIPWSGQSVWGSIQYKNVIGEPKYFSSYAEAAAYVSSQPAGNYAIGGFDPFVTIVPLEELSSYKRIYQSEDTTTVYGHTVPTVKIFEYLGSSES